MTYGLSIVLVFCLICGACCHSVAASTTIGRNRGSNGQDARKPDEGDYGVPLQEELKPINNFIRDIKKGVDSLYDRAAPLREPTSYLLRQFARDNTEVSSESTIALLRICVAAAIVYFYVGIVQAVFLAGLCVCFIGYTNVSAQILVSLLGAIYFFKRNILVSACLAFYVLLAYATITK